MWIIPKSIILSCVPGTVELVSDSVELSEVCAQSLTVRSKLSPSRTWSLKWKRDSWTRHLSGRILRPSHGLSFVTAWTSSVAATRASHSAQPASDSAPKTPDTSGRTYQPELLLCDQQYVSLKTSRDISRWGCPTSSKTWQDWVTERRGAYSARLKSARLTRGSGSSSWPTISVNESKNSVGKSQLDRNSIPLGTMAAWTTPTPWQQEESLESWEARKAKNKAKGYNGNGQGTPLDMQVKILGQAVPASSSSLGSRQGLWWMTPRACEAENPPMGVDKRHQVLTHQVKHQWATPQAKDHKSGHRDASIVQYKQLNVEVEAKATGKLNPRWVETLMGLPIGWTMPSCSRPVTIAPTSCDYSATESCRPPQSERSGFLLAS